MNALRSGAKVLDHEHFYSGILEVQSKKKNDQFVSRRSRGASRWRCHGLIAICSCSTLLEACTRGRWLLLLDGCMMIHEVMLEEREKEYQTDDLDLCAPGSETRRLGPRRLASTLPSLTLHDHHDPQRHR